jgi:AraC-like DNA-binding protein
VLPAVHTRHIVDLVKRWGVTAEALLGPLGIDEATLDDPGARMPIADVERIVRRSIELTGEAGLGFYLALEMRISWHGYLGFAAMTAPTLREALVIAERYTPTRTSTMELRLLEEGDMASLVLDEREDLGDAREVVVVGLLLGIATIGDAITGAALTGHAELAMPEPPHFARFQHVFERVRFAQPAHRLVFPSSQLDMRLTLADPGALRLATERCEAELAALGFDQRASARLRALLTSTLQQTAAAMNAEDAARALGMSGRTLKRRLADEKTSYSDILDDVRHKRALALLDDKRLTIAEIASRLGYADAPSFTHAFQRWTGQSPAAMRGATSSSGKR